MRRPLSESSTSCARRRARVSGFFALMTQNVATFLYPGGCAWKNSHARGLARNAFAEARSSFGAVLCSKE